MRLRRETRRPKPLVPVWDFAFAFCSTPARGQRHREAEPLIMRYIEPHNSRTARRNDGVLHVNGAVVTDGILASRLSTKIQLYSTHRSVFSTDFAVKLQLAPLALCDERGPSPRI